MKKTSGKKLNIDIEQLVADFDESEIAKSSQVAEASEATVDETQVSESAAGFEQTPAEGLDGLAFSEEEQSASPVDIQRQQAQALRWKTADNVFNILLWIAIILLVSLVLTRAFIASNIAVDGQSMMPTYENAEVLWVNKTVKPQRGQVVVFYKYDVDSKFLALFGTSEDNAANGKYGKLIKRVVAVEGDKIWVEPIDDNNYKLIVETPQGDRLQEDYYVKNGADLPATRFVIPKGNLGRLSEFTADNPHVMRAGYFFAMGDNRANSTDSRSVTIGDVPFERVFGTAIDDDSANNQTAE